MSYEKLRCLKPFVWLLAFSLVGCATQKSFNKPFSNQSGAKVVPSLCHYKAGPEEMLLFYLKDTVVEVTLRSDQIDETLLVFTRSKTSHATISDDLLVSHDGKKAKILLTKYSKSSLFSPNDSNDIYLSSVTIRVAGKYQDLFTLSGLTITSDGVTYLVKDIVFEKVSDVILTPWNC